MRLMGVPFPPSNSEMRYWRDAVLAATIEDDERVPAYLSWTEQACQLFGTAGGARGRRACVADPRPASRIPEDRGENRWLLHPTMGRWTAG
jgi:hypothetical protein